MKKIIIISLIIFCFTPAIFAQQTAIYSHNNLNGYLINPAIAGSNKYAPLRLTVRQQWAGFDDAPSTQILSYHHPLRSLNMGIGGHLYNDRFGVVSKTGVQLTYAYHLNLYKIDSKLGMGIGFSIFQFRVNESKLTTIEEDDPAISGGIPNVFMPDANFGLYLYNESYFVGLSGLQLFANDLKIGTEQNKIARHYYLTAGYKFNLGTNFMLEPSVLAKTIINTPFQVNGTLKAYFKKDYYMGVGYRTGSSGGFIIGMLGAKYDRYYIGYAVDFTLSNIRNYSYGSHEVLIGIDLSYKPEGSSLF